MSHKQYATITHYKEREFYFLNHAIQTNDGFIAKELEQFHESDKENFIARIRKLQAQYPTHQVISISLDANQVVKEEEDPNQASAEIFKNNFVMQEKMDVGNTPVTLYFSPFTVLYEEYKHKLDDKLTLMIGLFNRKLYIMFATKDKIHQSWALGTRGLTEKQIADRVYKSMKAYYKISFKFADQIEMLVSVDSPKLLKVLRAELSMSISPTQKTIHNLLHFMGSDQRKFSSSYIKSFLSLSKGKSESLHQPSSTTLRSPINEDMSINSLDDIRLNHTTEAPLASETKPEANHKTKEILKSNTTETEQATTKSKSFSFSLSSLIPLAFVMLSGLYFFFQNNSIDSKVKLTELQAQAQTNNALLAMNAKDVFSAMGKSAELKSAYISNQRVQLKGIVWGIEPLRNTLTELYSDGEFVIKPLENFMTEFSFKSKI